jgi:hypothetical protein
VWIYTQSNITNIIFTRVYNTNTEKTISLFLAYMLDLLLATGDLWKETCKTPTHWLCNCNTP